MRVRFGIRVSLPFGIGKNALTFVKSGVTEEQAAKLKSSVEQLKATLSLIGGEFARAANLIYVEMG